MVLYGSTLFTVYRLSGDWDICPQPISSSPTSEGRRRTANQPGDGTGTLNAATQLPTATEALSEQPLQGSLPDMSEVFARIDRLDRSILISQKERLKSQYRQLEHAQRHACEIGVFFFANRNAALTVTTAAGILAIACLAFVSKNGWAGTNNMIINIGITSGLVLFTTWTFSQLYGQGKNYESQRTKLALTNQLLNGIASASANRNVILINQKSDTSGGQTAPRVVALNSSDSMASLIQFLDTQLESINSIDFTGDASFAEGSVRRISTLLKTTVETPIPKP